jgi:hypothetical protein
MFRLAPEIPEITRSNTVKLGAAEFLTKKLA